MLQTVSSVTLLASLATLAIVVTLSTETHTQTVMSEPISVTSPSPVPDVITGYRAEVTTHQLADLLVTPISYPIPPAPEKVAELCDEKSGTCWRYGAWRYPNDSLYFFVEEKNPPISYYSAQPSAQAAAVIPSGTNPSLEECYNNPDRYNWRAYAAVYDWPLDELAVVIDNESKGDLCAINPTSGAICWIQEISGSYAYLDPAACMAQGYSKWVSGGRSFWQHWYQWWN